MKSYQELLLRIIKNPETIYIFNSVLNEGRSIWWNVITIFKNHVFEKHIMTWEISWCEKLGSLTAWLHDWMGIEDNTGHFCLSFPETAQRLRVTLGELKGWCRSWTWLSFRRHPCNLSACLHSLSPAVLFYLRFVKSLLWVWLVNIFSYSNLCNLCIQLLGKIFLVPLKTFTHQTSCTVRLKIRHGII